jgi:hypothetical protein
MVVSICKKVKSEARNNFPNENFKYFKPVLNLCHSKFGFVSDFDIRISDFTMVTPSENAIKLRR